MEVQEEMPAVPEPVKINAGSQPLAFGNLLESPVTEPEEEEELGYATTARPELERDWKSGGKEDEVVEEEEETESASWRRDGGDDAMEEEAASGPVKDWRQTAFAEAPARKMRNESWAPQKEISSLEEAAETEQSVGAMVTDAPITETRVPPPAIASFTEEAWVTALRPKIAVETATMEAPAPEPAVPAIHEQQVAAEVQEDVHAEIPISTPAPVEAPPEPEKLATPAASSWFSSVASPWDAEVQKASRLASTWDTPATSTVLETVVYAGGLEALQDEAAKEDPAATVDALTPVLSADMKAEAEEAALPAATVEAIREEAQHVAEAAVWEAPAVDTSSKAPEPSMEDLVAKVLAKMSPDMLQAVTRDILKNVVESMVRDELNAKKQ
jgi:hypothetical protein